MGVYEDLIAWSTERPRWQRDALRRLAQQGELRPSDIVELADLAVAEAQDSRPTSVGQPLTATYLPTNSAGGLSVLLRSISDVENVNALARGVRIEFAENGLTVIYGDNGSGKSGYVRILKKVCRARASGGGIHPNVFNSARGPIAATVEFRAGGATGSARWGPRMEAPEALGAVSIFDRECASVYVTGENEVAYRPFGLDLLDSLAGLMDQVRSELERRKLVLIRALVDPPPELLSSAAMAGLWPLRASASSAAIATRSGWADADGTELATLERALGEESPTARAAALRSVRNTYLKAHRRVRETADAVTAEAIQKLAETRSRDVGASEALMLATHDAFEAAPVPGVGGEAWQQLWEAARRYAEEDAYPGHVFPNLAPDARCVFCGQELDEEARSRFAAFRAFVEGEVNERAVTARRRFDESSAPFSSLVASEELDRPLLDELRSIDPDLTTRVETFLDAVRARGSAALAACENGRWVEIPPAIESPETSLDQAAEQQRVEANVLEQASQPDQAVALRKRRVELRGREWLNVHRDAIKVELDRMKRDAIHDRAIGTCDTHPITYESNILTERYVTGRLAEDLEHELEALNAGRLPVRVAKRGQRGATYHRIELRGSQVPGAKVEDIASEGEFAALALAAFLAEVGQSGTSSGVVLDDPVSSLDHLHRRGVAQRLSQEAVRRQVVIFTHDLVFLHDLEQAATDWNVAITIRRLRIQASVAGVPEDGPPWQSQKVSARIGFLQDTLSKARGAYNAADLDQYELLARDWYGRLRETWERAVEDVLFGGVVNRYRHDVQTKRFRSGKVWILTEEDGIALDRGMAKCSAQLRGHDQPAAANDPVPPPQELVADLEDLSGWVKRIEQRRKL
jgi:energy-coupling factor transporter ATP-binding protein EcfA2